MENRDRWERLLSGTRVTGTTGPSVQVDGDRVRSSFHKDYDRIVFSSAFRRLQDKTQVYPLPQSDYVRRRLTHSLEVAAVGRCLGRRAGLFLKRENYLPDDVSIDAVGTIVVAACLAHDIGNPPFGHAGERSIRNWFKQKADTMKGVDQQKINDLKNFDGNPQGLRILTSLQDNPGNGGLRLTTAVVAAFVKYPCISTAQLNEENDKKNSWKKVGIFSSEEEVFRRVAKSTGLREMEDLGKGVWQRHPLNFLVEAADDICNACVDVEDAYRMNYCEFYEAENHLEQLAKHKNIDRSRYNKMSKDEKIGYLRAAAVGVLIDSIADFFEARHNEIIEGRFNEAIIDLVDDNDCVKNMKKFVSRNVFESQQVSKIECAGDMIISNLLDKFGTAVLNQDDEDDQSSLNQYLRILPAYCDGHLDKNKSLYERLLHVTDFIAGMTDNHSLSIYREINGFSHPATSSNSLSDFL